VKSERTPVDARQTFPLGDRHLLPGLAMSSYQHSSGRNIIVSDSNIAVLEYEQDHQSITSISHVAHKPQHLNKPIAPIHRLSQRVQVASALPPARATRPADSAYEWPRELVAHDFGPGGEYEGSWWICWRDVRF